MYCNSVYFYFSSCYSRMATASPEKDKADSIEEKENKVVYLNAV